MKMDDALPGMMGAMLSQRLLAELVRQRILTNEVASAMLKSLAALCREEKDAMNAEAAHIFEEMAQYYPTDTKPN